MAQWFVCVVLGALLRASSLSIDTVTQLFDFWWTLAILIKLLDLRNSTSASVMGGKRQNEDPSSVFGPPKAKAKVAALAVEGLR